MGIVSNIKNKYKVNKNPLWVVNFIFQILAVCNYIFVFLYYFKFAEYSNIFNNDESFGFTLSLYILYASLVVSVFLSAFCNRKFINYPMLVTPVVVLIIICVMNFICDDISFYFNIVPFISVILGIITIVHQTISFKSKYKENQVVKVAKVKLDFDFSPKDIVEEYQLSLSEIEKRYDMGNRDREKFEQEKDELMQDTHEILKKFIGSKDIELLDKLETLYLAKVQCIIREDSYILWKNKVIKHADNVDDIKEKIEKQLARGKITTEEFSHFEELLKEEF